MKENKYSKRLRLACRRAAFVIFDMWSERGYSDTRLLLPPLIPDDAVTIGNSILGSEVKEHVIPRKVIIDKCHEIFRSGGNSNDAEAIIIENLRIVWISKKEAEILNKSEHLNLRQRMPTSWSFEDGDKYERIKAAGIKLVSDDGFTK